MLYVHCLLHGALIYLVTTQWQNWLIPATVVVTHFVIDLWKLHKHDKAIFFIADQSLHFLVLVILWVATHPDQARLVDMFTFAWGHMPGWSILLGYLLMLWPGGIMIGYLTQRWRNDINDQLEQTQRSLAEAGKWIGMFERVLVYTFIITQQYAGIGFLITAKSILRFSETKKETGRKEAEYILIGTLISFSFAILTGLLILLII